MTKNMKPLGIENLFQVAGKVALITGGSRGIGFMLANALVQNGARVYITARKQPDCESAIKELSKFGFARALPADLSKPSEIPRLVKELERHESSLHILINNAGTNWSQPLEEYSQDGFEKVMKLNVQSAFQLTQSCLPLLQAAATAQNPSRVVNIGSINGIDPPSFETYAYSASKAALHMLTRHLAAKLADRNILVNAIAPGSFPSRMMNETLEKFGDVIVDGTPCKRVGEPEDMAGVVLWLCSRAGNYVCGEIIVVDGGVMVKSKM